MAKKGSQIKSYTQEFKMKAIHLYKMETLKSLCERKDLSGAILHSDQGYQDTSNHFNKQL